MAKKKAEGSPPPKHGAPEPQTGHWYEITIRVRFDHAAALQSGETGGTEVSDDPHAALEDEVMRRIDHFPYGGKDGNGVEDTTCVSVTRAP